MSAKSRSVAGHVTTGGSVYRGRGTGGFSQPVGTKPIEPNFKGSARDGEKPANRNRDAGVLLDRFSQIQRMCMRVALLLFALTLLEGCREKRAEVQSDSVHQAPVLDRKLEWGEDYFDLTDTANVPDRILNIGKLETLFGAKFSVVTPFYVNEYSKIECCPVPFGGHTYYVTKPLPVGSRNNSTWGFDFFIRMPENPQPETDMSISILFDSYRRLVSVAYRDGVFGSTRQHFVDPDTIEPSVQLAAAVRESMFRAMKGDGHADAHWRQMPRFAEKFILAINNSIDRN